MKFGTEIGHKRMCTLCVTFLPAEVISMGPLVLYPTSLMYKESVHASQK